MPSSIQPSATNIGTALERCLGVRSASVEPVSGGANNRVYRVTVDDHTYALKFYPMVEQDPRDRLGTEKAATRFLREHGVTQVPCLIETDPLAGCALFEWAEGVAVDAVESSDLTQMLGFVERLVELRGASGTEHIALASEACLSGAEIVRQVSVRRQRLSGSADLTKSATSLLKDVESELVQLAAKADLTCTKAGIPFDLDIEKARRVLNPSDFGFHNALRRPDGTLVILDLEYFGWDDPVKLAADFLLHPGMALTLEQRADFLGGLRRIFADDDAFETRLRAFYPLFALRWVMIIMNEFLPERWHRRVQAGETGHREDVLAGQLKKAVGMFRHAQSAGRAFPYDS